MITLPHTIRAHLNSHAIPFRSNEISRKCYYNTNILLLLTTKYIIYVCWLRPFILTAARMDG